MDSSKKINCDVVLNTKLFNARSMTLWRQGQAPLLPPPVFLFTALAAECGGLGWLWLRFVQAQEAVLSPLPADPLVTLLAMARTAMVVAAPVKELAMAEVASV